MTLLAIALGCVLFGLLAGMFAAWLFLGPPLRRANDAVLTMRRDGYSLVKPGKVRQPIDVEAVAKNRAETAFVTKARAVIMKQTGVDVATAEREARRLRDEVDAQHPEGG